MPTNTRTAKHLKPHQFQPGHEPVNLQDLVDFNRRRHQDGVKRQVESARAALPKLQEAPAELDWWRTEPVMARYRQAVKLRIDHPELTITELAVLAGMPRGRFWSILRRALKLADTLPEPSESDEWVMFK